MDHEDYIKDIEIIKNILIKQKKTPIIESWAFFVLLSLNGLFLYSFILAGLIGLAMIYLGIYISSAFYGVSVILLALLTTLFFIPLDRALSSYLCGILVSLGMLGAGIINKKVQKGHKDVS